MNKVTAFLTIIVGVVVIASDYSKHLWSEMRGYERFIWATIVSLALFGGLAVAIAPIVWEWASWLLLAIGL